MHQKGRVNGKKVQDNGKSLLQRHALSSGRRAVGGDPPVRSLCLGGRGERDRDRTGQGGSSGRGGALLQLRKEGAPTGSEVRRSRRRETGRRYPLLLAFRISGR